MRGRIIKIAGLIGLIAIVVYGNIRREESIVQGVVVVIDYDGGDTLIRAKTLEEHIMKTLPQLGGQRVKEIDEAAVEAAAATSPYIAASQVSVSSGAKIVVHARQRRPIVRMYYQDKEFYIDEEGRCVPESEEGEYDCIVGSGHFRQKMGKGYRKLDIAEMRRDSVKRGYDIVGVWEVAKYIDEHEEWRDHFDQIYREKNRELVLIPAEGSYRVIIGEAEGIEEKLRRYARFRDKVLPRKGWDYYKAVNLKYAGQVVAQKR